MDKLLKRLNEALFSKQELLGTPKKVVCISPAEAVKGSPMALKAGNSGLTRGESYELEGEPYEENGIELVSIVKDDRGDRRTFRASGFDIEEKPMTRSEYRKHVEGDDDTGRPARTA